MTEAERIEKDAEEYAHSKEISLSTAFFCRYRGYIAGATAENERLQELIKEKDDKLIAMTNIKMDTLISEGDRVIKNLKERGELEAELKASQELNRELVGIAKLYISLKKQILDYLPNDDEAKVELEEIEDIINKSLATKEDTTDKSNYSSDLQ